MYIGETKRNVSIRVNEHEKWNGNSEPAKHLIKYPAHAFKWSILSSASPNWRTRKNLESSFIALFKPSLNDQLLSNELNLFRNNDGYELHRVFTAEKKPYRRRPR